MVKRRARQLAIAGVLVLALASLAGATTDTAGGELTATLTQYGISIVATAPPGSTCVVYRQANVGDQQYMPLREVAPGTTASIWDMDLAPGIKYKYTLRAIKGRDEGLEGETLAETGWIGPAAEVAPPNVRVVKGYGLMLPMDGRQYEIGISTDGYNWTTKTVTSEYGPSPVPPEDIPPKARIRVRVAGNPKNQYAYAYAP